MRKLFVLSGIALFFSSSVFAADNNCESIIKNFPGTYSLIKRTLSNGTVLKGPQAQGTLIYTKDDASAVTISVYNPAEKIYDMVALQTEYSLSSTKFTNKIKAMALQNGKPSSVVKYIFDQPKVSSPVTCENGVLDLKNPADYPLTEIKITKSTLTAYHDDTPPKAAVDEWKKISD